MRVAFFGGSFDPPHVGHVLAVSYALSTEAIDMVLVVPVYEHAFSKPLSAFEDRVALTTLALQSLKNVEVSSIEGALTGPSYTLRTLQALKQQHPDWELSLLLGSDAFATRNQWRGFSEIEAIAPPIVLRRAGSASEVEPQLLPEVSSSQIRRLLQERPNEQSAELLSRLVPRNVLAYIAAHGLYRDRPS